MLVLVLVQALSSWNATTLRVVLAATPYADMEADDNHGMVSTGILGRRMAPFPPFLIPHRVPHGFTPRS